MTNCQSLNAMQCGAVMVSSGAVLGDWQVQLKPAASRDEVKQRPPVRQRYAGAIKRYPSIPPAECQPAEQFTQRLQLQTPSCQPVLT